VAVKKPENARLRLEKARKWIAGNYRIENVQGPNKEKTSGLRALKLKNKEKGSV